MKQKTHRLLSLLLCFLMIMGLMPTTAYASTPGRTEDNPAVCKTFDEFKAAMENPSIQYVKLVGDNTPGYYKKDTIPVTEDGVSRDAVLCDGQNKVLILEGKTKFEGPATSKSLINLSINNRLTITGDGTLAYWHSNYHRESAVVNLVGENAQLTVEDGVRLRGFAEAGNTHGRAIYAKTGTVIINGGILYGEDALTTNADEIFTSAVTITGNANLTVNGGYISTTREEDKQCESALYLNTTGTVNLREGEILEAGIVVVPNTLTINGSAYFVGSRVYTKSGSEWIEQSDRTQPVSILEGTNVKMSFTQFIDAATVTVTDPMDSQAPDTTSFTVGNSSYTVDKITWYSGGTVDNPGTKMTSGDTFEAGQTYIVDVHVKPTKGSGYVIQNGCTVTINGVSTDKVFYRDGVTGAGNYRVALTAQPAVLTGRVQFTSVAHPGEPINMVTVGGTVKDVASSALHYQWQIKDEQDKWVNVTVSNPTERNYVPTSEQVGKVLRVVVTADGYEGSIVSDGVTVTKLLNSNSPIAPALSIGKDSDGKYSVLIINNYESLCSTQEYVYREALVSDTSTIDWNDGKIDSDKIQLTENGTYYVYTRFKETADTEPGIIVVYNSITLKDPQYLQKLGLEGYTDYGDGNTIYIPVGKEVTVNIGKYPMEAMKWSYFTFGDPSNGSCYTVTSEAKVQDTMPTSITLKGNSVGSGVLKAYYNGGMYYYGSWNVVVYDPEDPDTYSITFTNTPAYEDITLTVGDSFTPTAPSSGLMLPTEANDKFEYKWYVYEACAFYGSPYGMVEDNGYISIDPITGTVTALSAEFDENKGSIYQPYAVLYLVDKTNSNSYKYVTSYKVTVCEAGEIPVESVTVVPSDTTMAPGSAMTPTAVINPTNHTQEGIVVWSKLSGSDNITVDPSTGRVSVSDSAALGETATIRATFGDKYGECVITVDTAKQGVTVFGTVTSFNSTTDDVTIQLIEIGASEAAYITVVHGNTAEYSIEGVSIGTYTMKVTKNGHVPREYSVTVGTDNVSQDVKICLLGDVNMDGTVSMIDVTEIQKAIANLISLNEYQNKLGDVNKDGYLKMVDVTQIQKYIAKLIEKF